MRYTVFLINLLPLLMGMCSIITSIIVYKYKYTNQKWYFYFIHILICLTLFPAIYSTFTLLFGFNIWPVDKLFVVYVSIVIPTYIYLNIGVFNTCINIAVYKNEELLRKIFKTLLIFFCILWFFLDLILIINNILLKPILFVIIINFLLIISLGITKIKEVSKDKTKQVWVISFTAFAIITPLAALYYLFAAEPYTINLRLPIVSIQCTFIHLINIFYNFKFISEIIEKKPPKVAISKESLSDKDHLIIFFEQYKISKREMHILNMLLLEKSRSQISEELNIVIRTVEKHIENIYKKCSVNSLPGLYHLLNAQNIFLKTKDSDNLSHLKPTE